MASTVSPGPDDNKGPNISAAKGKELRDKTGADVLALAGDLDRPDTIRDLVAAAVGRFGRLDILVNNSGGPPLARAASATEEQWATAVQRSLLRRQGAPDIRA